MGFRYVGVVVAKENAVIHFSQISSCLFEDKALLNAGPVGVKKPEL